MDTPDNDNWYERYRALAKENLALKARIKELEQPDAHRFRHEPMAEAILIQAPLKTRSPGEPIDNLSEPARKIDLFISLFKGRKDVHAKRWKNKRGVSGIHPCV